jgi:hypothetical protein
VHRALSIVALVLALAVPAVGQVRRPSRDRALVIADEIDALVPTFRPYRDESSRGEWREVPSWSIRESRACLDDARARGLSLTPIRTTRTPIPTPVRLDGAVSGVTFEKTRRGAPFYVACELAVRMPAIAAVLRAHHVTTALVLSSWRTAPRTSFHTMGLALDLARFVRDDGTVLDVERDFVLAPERPTCDSVDRTPSDEPRAALRAIACSLRDDAGLSTVITPEYNEGHRDHFHVDVRPHDTRAFTR